jgi:hypothetical protein
MTDRLEIDLRRMADKTFYNELYSLTQIAILDESEDMRRCAIKSLIGAFELDDIFISRGDCVDNQFLLTGEYRCRPTSIYVGDKPQKYKNSEPVIKNFDVRKI